MYYILDNSGNKIIEFKTTIEAAKAFETTPNTFTVCANNIAKIIRNEQPRNGVLQVKGLTCVKKKDYELYESKIRWILTKNDIFIINRNGEICGTFKTQNGLLKILSQGNAKTSSNITYALNKVDSEVYGYRIATREHYINMLKEDIMYYNKEFDNSGGLKKIPVDMYHIENGYIKDFESLTEAANYMGCSKETIRQSIKEEREILNTGYYFKKKDLI